MAQGPSRRPLGPLQAPTGIDDQVRRAYAGPCAHAYSPKMPEPASLGGGRFSESKLKEVFEHGAHQKTFVPGPGSYQMAESRDFSLPEGGRLNRAPPQERLKLDEQPIPAPGTYGIPPDPTVPRQLYGSFGKDPRITKFIQDEVTRSRAVPAPGEHEVMDAMENVRPFCPEGGRYMEHGRQGSTYFDSAAKLAEGKPAPDRYNLPGAIKPNKTHGKLVWKYKSETIENTKKIITKVVGSGQENPAPGHYTLPDPAPLMPVPTLKGRDTAPPMPHPFAYNCAPDHGRKFLDSYAPVREQNSGDQIYGRDLQKGAGARPSSKDRVARAKKLADEVAANNLPKTLAERGVEQPGESVQWRSGGFGILKRAKSAPGMSRAEMHPAVEATMKNYPAMAKANGRHDRTFAPWASRRPETVSTHKRSDAYQSLQRKKWEIGAIANALANTTAAAMEPLDEQLLRQEATEGLMDKAKFRMRMEGLSAEQQELVLSEFPAVLQETASPTPSPMTSIPVSAMPSVRDPLAEPFREPLSFAIPQVPLFEPFAEPAAQGESAMLGSETAEPLAEP